MTTTTTAKGERCGGADPAVGGDPWSRLRFHYGQLLGAEDFTAEQKTAVLRHRLHLALCHGFGTVWGLKVGDKEGSTTTLTVEPGLAVDAVGREIHVPTELCLPDVEALAHNDLWESLAVEEIPGPTVDDPPLQVHRAYVVLGYQACETTPVPAIARACASEDDAFAYGRVRDDYCVELTAEPPDPYDMVRQWLPEAADTERQESWRTPRDRLLDFMLNSDGATRPELCRYWTGLEKAGVLLAEVDLATIDDEGVVRVEIAAIRNAVRPLLPPVQLLGEQLLGQRLTGRDNRSPLVVLGITPLEFVTEGAVERGQVAIELSDELAPASQAQRDAWVTISMYDPSAADPAWQVLTTTTTVQDRTLTASFDSATWTVETIYEVRLPGQSASPVIAADGRPLAGFWDEGVPASDRGRDVNVVRTWTP